MTTDVAIDDAVLDRLIEQFASPYDFLRELVQNGMDAGSVRVEVELHVHGEPGAAEVAFELCVIDDGCGMTESVIDVELARLFASSKRSDRTMAGGFGVGFVSVFAWRPDAVLLQTGRHGESWELEFDRTARFAKQRLLEPIEGTTVRLFRRGRREEHATISAAARASLWRWCRFCPIEITFTDAADGQRIPIRDVETDADAAAMASHRAAESHVHVAFAMPPRAVLLRHGLVLAEAAPQILLPRVFGDWPATATHVQIWASSPSLVTDIGRDHVVDDAGRKLIEQRVVDLIHVARRELVSTLVRLAAAPEWTAEIAAQYAYLHAHLAAERSALRGEIEHAKVIRLADGSACSIRALVEHARWCAVECLVEGGTATAAIAGVPRVIAERDARGDWLRTWLEPSAIAVVMAGSLILDVTPLPRSPDDLFALVESVLPGIVREIRLGTFAGATRHPWAAQIGEHQGVLPPARPPEPPIVWIDPRHPLIAAASDGHRSELDAVATLAFAITHWLGASRSLCYFALERYRAGRGTKASS